MDSMRSDDTSTSYNEFHTPVLVEPVLTYLAPTPGNTVLDATEGGAGHSWKIAAAISPGGTLIGLDRDADALEVAESRLAPFRSNTRIILRHCEFDKIAEVLSDLGGGSPIRLDGCLFDLGVSSYQLEHGLGFSFRRDEYLDGRMNRRGDERTVAELLAETDEDELAHILWDFGQERFARRIARRIAEFKSRGSMVETTGQLVRLVEDAVPRSAWPRDIHVATKVFQALRMMVNGELDQLRAGLNTAIDNLAQHGRIVAICYQSLEDGIVKSTLAKRAGKAPGASGYSPAALMPNQFNTAPELKLLTRKPVVADELEKRINIRSRSAKLRAAERIA